MNLGLLKMLAEVTVSDFTENATLAANNCSIQHFMEKNFCIEWCSFIQYGDILPFIFSLNDFGVNSTDFLDFMLGVIFRIICFNHFNLFGCVNLFNPFPLLVS